MGSNKSRSNFGNSIKETGIMVFFSLVVFSIMLGLPTLLNTSQPQNAFAEKNIELNYNFQPNLFAKYGYSYLVMQQQFPMFDPFSKWLQDQTKQLSELIIPSVYADTFGYTTGTDKFIFTTSISGFVCSTIASGSTADAQIELGDSDVIDRCERSSTEWNISTIPDVADIIDVDLRFDVSIASGATEDCDFNSIEHKPSTSSNQGLYDDIGNGTTFVNTSTLCHGVASDKLLDLGTSADSDLESNLVDDWWAVGIKYDPESRTPTGIFSNFGDIELQVTYTLPPDPITDLQARIENTTNIFSAGSSTSETLDQFPLIVTQLIEPSVLTRSLLIDSLVYTSTQGASNAFSDGIIHGIIIGDRTGDLDRFSLLSDIYFIENSTNTFSASSLGTTMILNFSGNTILDEDDNRVGIGVYISSANNNPTFDLSNSVSVTYPLTTTNLKALSNGWDCLSDSSTFDYDDCTGTFFAGIDNFDIKGGNARTVLNWTAPADNGDPITGYQINIANATVIQELDEIQDGETHTREIIGTDADPYGIIGQRITFPTDIALQGFTVLFGDGVIGSPFSSTGFYHGVIVQGDNGTSNIGRIANSSNTEIITSTGEGNDNPTEYSSFGNCCPQMFSFDNVLLEGGTEYIIGVEVFGADKSLGTSSNANDATGHPNSGLGHLTELHVGTGDIWFDTTSTEFGINLFGINMTTETANTGNTNTEYTSTADFPTNDEKISAYVYEVSAINSVGTANGSNVVEISPDRSDSFDAWQYREHKERVFFGVNCEYNVEDGGTFSLNITQSSSLGSCIILKSFDANLMDGSDIRIDYGIPLAGSSTIAIVDILDGSYDKDNATDFPPNLFVDTASLLKGGGVLNHTVVFAGQVGSCTPTGFVFPQECSIIIPAESIDYASSTEDEITLVFRNFASAGAGKKYTVIDYIAISNVGSWNFTQSPRIIKQINLGTISSTVLDDNQDDRGIVISNSVFNGTVDIFLPPPNAENLTATADGRTALLDWDQPLGDDVTTADANDFAIQRNGTTIVPSVVDLFPQVWQDDFSSYPDNATGSATWVPTIVASDTIIGIDVTDGAFNGIPSFLDGSFETPDSISTHTDQGAGLRFIGDRLSADKVVLDFLPILGQTLTDSSGLGDFSLRWTAESVWCKDNNPVGAPQSGVDCYALPIDVGLSDTTGRWDSSTSRNAVIFEWNVDQDSVFLNDANLFTQNDGARTFKFGDTTCGDGSNTRTLTSHYDSAVPSSSKFGKQDLVFYELNKTGTTYSMRVGNAPDYSGYGCSASGVIADIYQNLRYLVISKVSGGAVANDQRDESRFDNFELFTDGAGTPLSRYVDSSVSLGTSYNYQVIPINDNGNATSNIATVLTNDIPSAVTGATATFVGTTQIDVQWNNVTSTGEGSPSTGIAPIVFDIFKENITDASAIFSFENNTSDLFVNDTQVDHPKSYSYKISSQNSIGNGANTTVTLLSIVPSAITDLTTQVVSNTCNLSWSTPSTSGFPVTGYNILRAVDGGSFITLVSNTGTTATTYSDLGLVVNSNYQYDVRGINAIGTASGSNIASCIPASSGAPNPPTNLTLQNQNDDVLLSWNAPVTGSTPTGYKIERKVESGVFEILVSDTGNTNITFLDTTIPALGTEVTYRVTSLNTFGQSATTSNESTITTSNPPNMPTLMASQNGNQIDLSWTQPTSDGTINGYKIERRINGGTFSDLVSNTTTTSLTYSDLAVTKPNTYGYKVSALNDIPSTGTPSNIVDVPFGSHVTVLVREQDGSSYKGGGSVEATNSTFTQTNALNSLSNAIFDNLDTGSYNFTFIDLDNFILNKTLNFPFPSGNSSSSFQIDALVFDVDCPINGQGTDVRIKLNYTQIQDIFAFPSTPVCDSNDKVSWSTTFDGTNGTGQSKVVADFISPRFKANADSFVVGLVPVSTTYDIFTNRITSSTFDVTTASQTTQIFDLFLGDAPPSSPAPSSSPSASSGSVGASIPANKIIFEDRLTGLTILSISHMFIKPNDVITGQITIGWNGEDEMSVKKIDVGEFTDLIRFTDTPTFVLDKRTEGAGETARSEATVGYTIFIPPAFCDEEQGILLNCLKKELITIPITFTLEFQGQEFIGETEVILDAREIPVDIVQLQIIGLGLVVLISAFVGNALRKRFKRSNKRKAKIKKRLTSS